MKLKVRSTFVGHSDVFSLNLQVIISSPQPSCIRACQSLKSKAEAVDWHLGIPGLNDVDEKYLTIDNLRFVSIWNRKAQRPQYTAYGTAVLHLVDDDGGNGFPKQLNAEDGHY